MVLEHRGQHSTLTGRQRGQGLLESAGPGTARATWVPVNPGNMPEYAEILSSGWMQQELWFHSSGAQVFSRRVETRKSGAFTTVNAAVNAAVNARSTQRERERIAEYSSMGPRIPE